MSSNKAVVLSIAAASLVIGGIIIANNNPDSSSSSGSSNSLADTGAYGDLFPEVSFKMGAYPDWLTGAKAYEAANPNPGLRNIITSLETVQRPTRSAYQVQQDLLDKTIKEGWSQPSDGLLPLLTANAQVMASAIAAANDAGTDLPPIADANAKLPIVSDVQLIHKLLLADAQRLRASGDLNGAAARTGQALRFSGLWRSRTMPLIMSLVTIGGCAKTASVMEQVVNDAPQGSPAALDILTSVYGFDTTTSSVAEWMAGEGLFVITAAKSGNMPSAKGEKPGELKLLAGNAKEVDGFWKEYLQTAGGPTWEHASAMAAIKRNSAFHKVLKPNLEETVGRLQTMQAKLRNVAVAAAIKSGRQDLVGLFPDPFTGKPMASAPGQ